MVRDGVMDEEMAWEMTLWKRMQTLIRWRTSHRS